MENNEKFDSKSSIIGGVILYGGIALAGIYLIIDLLLMSEFEFVKYMEHYINTGTGASRSSSSIVNFFYSYFGKTGSIIFLLCCNIILLLVSVKEIKTLRRYLHKEKLFKMGLVSDMDDDCKPLSLFKFIKSLFRKNKNNQRKVKIYSRRELKEMKRELLERESTSRKTKGNVSNRDCSERK